jgi:phage terminase small subunit
MSNELTEKQAAFVTNFVANGGNGSAAAVDAGYAEASARQSAYNLVRLPHVQDAINREMRREIASMTVLGLGKLKAVLENPDTKATVILDATIKLADRAGLGPKSDADSDKDSKPLSELSLAELHAIIRASNARAAQEAGAEPVAVPDQSEVA